MDRHKAAEPRGFMVVRRAEFNTRESDVVGPQAPPRVDGILYCGVDRMGWADVDVAFYENSLPDDLAAKRAAIWAGSPAELDFKLCANLPDANALLEFSNRLRPQNELIAVDSDSLARYPVIATREIEIEWLGSDIYCHGFGSQMLGGLFSRPQVFAEFVADLNEYGLFGIGSPVIHRYKDAYVARAAKAGLEPIGRSDQLDTVHVGRVAMRLLNNPK